MAEQAQDIEIFTFRLEFEGIRHLPVPLSAYMSDAQGRLVDGADVWVGTVLLALTETEIRTGRLLVVPFGTDDLDDCKVTAHELLNRHAFEPVFSVQSGQRDYALPPIPESVWRAWLLTRGCRVRRTQPRSSGFLIY